LRKRLENSTKPNSQLFAEYLSIIKASKSFKWFKETERLLNQFREFLGEFPPSLELLTKFFERYSSREIRLSTRARYYYVFSAFFKWYNGSTLPFKVKSPKPIPQKVSDEEVAKLKAAMTSRKTHKELIERDILIIDAYYNTGMRLADLVNLRVRDLYLDGLSPYLMVLQGKGGKDRQINLNPFICGQLKAFTLGKAPDDSVFGIASKTIQSMIRNWAVKAGVPQLGICDDCHKEGPQVLLQVG
jgi:site-specific recombinase XerD